MNDELAQHHWWWLLFGLLTVAALMAALRAWLQTQQVPSVSLDPAPAGDVSSALAPLVASVTPAPEADAVVPTTTARQQLQDALTGLSTRLGLEDKLAAALARCDARERRVALLYIDIDGFKPINETHGQRTGDRVLREMGQRLQRLGRTTDVVARMDGDEFLMMLDGDPDMSSAALVADRVRDTLQQPCVVGGESVALSCSIGIVLYPDHGPKAKLIARADTAMRSAKQAGGNMHCLFDAHMDGDLHAGIDDLQRDLRQALQTHDGLSLHYQPKVDGRTGQITGVEALLRWQHAQLGSIGPAVFVPVAERFGLIGKLGQWVIDEACAQVRAWMDQGLQMRMAINLSVHQLRQADLVEQVQQSLSRHRVPPEFITFEVSESAAMADAQALLDAFERLAQSRVSVAVDGFGAGYASLSHLRKLPAKQLKIDRSLVQGVDAEGDAQAIVRAVIKLAHAMGLQVVAVGVETLAQQLTLQRMGCDLLQGHLYAQAMPPERLRAWANGPDLPCMQPSFQLVAFDCEESPNQATQTPARMG
jgi:diguanylate cyclase (GGDEF)-like protein